MGRVGVGYGAEGTIFCFGRGGHRRIEEGSREQMNEGTWKNFVWS